MGSYSQIEESSVLTSSELNTKALGPLLVSLTTALLSKNALTARSVSQFAVAHDLAKSTYNKTIPVWPVSTVVTA